MVARFTRSCPPADVLALWAAANDVSSLSTRMKAAEALKRLQDDHGLSDVELNYIAESEQRTSRPSWTELSTPSMCSP